MDLLRDLLARAQPHGAVIAETAITADAGIQFGGARLLALHTVRHGAVWFERAGCEPVRVTAGELMLVPRGLGYRIVPFVGAPSRDYEPAEDDVGAMTSQPDSDCVARLIFGAYTMQAPLSLFLLGELPPLVPIRPVETNPRLALTLRLMRDELAEPHPGSGALLDHTLRVLLAHSLRAWFTQPGVPVPDWARALGDPTVGPAIYAIHADPGRDWTVDELARVSAVSRARFARRFREVVGRPPVASLTQWRMQIAAQLLLEDPELSLAAIATQVGYRSEYAFATAFRRQHGEPPGRWRRSRRAIGFATHE